MKTIFITGVFVLTIALIFAIIKIIQNNKQIKLIKDALNNTSNPNIDVLKRFYVNEVSKHTGIEK